MLIRVSLHQDYNIFPCTSCQKGVRSTSKAIECDLCLQWTHLACTSDISLDKYNSSDKIPFVCNQCALIDLPNIFPDQASDDNIIQDNDSYVEAQPQFDCFQQKGLHFIHINARSLLPKIDELSLLAKSTNVAVMAITESWLDETIPDSEIAIPGYILERKDRNREGGGVCMFIRDNLAFNRRNDLISEDQIYDVTCSSSSCLHKCHMRMTDNHVH